MPELRKDPITERWVIIATERGKRPNDFGGEVSKEKGTDAKNCPFCAGAEKKTPPEIIAWRDDGSAPDTPGWAVRAMENKFPALTSEGEIHRSGFGLFDVITGIGAHEVIVEHPDHHMGLADMSVSQIEKVLWAYKHRLEDLQKDPRFRYVLIFKNHGEVAGASLSHPHSQLIATPITPRYVKLELTTCREFYQQKERCIFCDLVRQELSAGERVVEDNEHFVTLAPFASRFPFETWILPRKHSARFKNMSEAERSELARMLKDTMYRMKETLGDPPFNYVLHTAPTPSPRGGKPDYWGTIELDYHWHIEITPRLTRIAGFESGAGLYINPTPPEEATKYLRQVHITS